MSNRPIVLYVEFLPGTRVLEFIEHSDAIGLAPALIGLRDWIDQYI